MGLSLHTTNSKLTLCYCDTWPGSLSMFLSLFQSLYLNLFQWLTKNVLLRPHILLGRSSSTPGRSTPSRSTLEPTFDYSSPLPSGDLLSR